MGNKNAITYKEFFPLLRNNEVWVGYTSLNGGRWMILPKNITVKSKKTKVDADGNTILNVAGVCWFTNLDHPKRHELIDTPYLYAKRDALYPDLYPKYDNYDAINIDKLSEIPMDYEGVMGVPITFLDKYNPEQFEIVAFRKGEDGKDLVFTRERESSTVLSYPCTTSIPGMIKNAEGAINGRNTYARITIRRTLNR